MKNCKTFYEGQKTSRVQEIIVSSQPTPTLPLPSCSRRVGDSRWSGSLTMVPGGNKAKRLSLVDHTTKTIHHHQIKSYYVFRTSFIQTFAFKVLQKCSSWVLINGANIFSDTKQKHVCRKVFKVRSFWLYCGSILFSTSSVLRFVNE